jgi:hypothetical protein
VTPPSAVSIGPTEHARRHRPQPDLVVVGDVESAAFREGGCDAKRLSHHLIFCLHDAQNN